MSFRPKTKTYTGVSVAATGWIPLDWRAEAFTLAYFVEKGATTGDVTYSVQGTLDDPFKNQTLTAFDLVSGKTTNFQGAWTSPITAVRLNITAVSGAATLNFHLLQNQSDA